MAEYDMDYARAFAKKTDAEFNADAERRPTMGEWEKRLHRVKFNIPKDPSPDFFVEIDGKRIEGVCGLTIQSRMATDGPYPRVTISFLAIEATGEIEGEIVEKTTPPTSRALHFVETK